MESLNKEFPPFVKPKRIMDIDGQFIVHPAHYGHALDGIKQMVDHMDADNVDRSDMIAALTELYREAMIHVTLHLETRQ